MPITNSSSLRSRCQFAWQVGVDGYTRWRLIGWLVWFSLALRLPLLRKWLQATQKAHLTCIRYQEQMLSLYLRAQDVPILMELFQDEVYRLPQAVLHDLAGEVTIVDIGAHIGLASRYFRAQGIQGQWVAVEPSPTNFVVLQQNLSSLADAQLIDKGIGSPDIAYSIAEETYSYNHRLQAVNKQHNTSVTTITLEELLAPYYGIDLLKVDIEGAEQEALRNAYLWRQKVRYLWIELHAPYTLAELKRDLAIEDSQILIQRADTILIQVRA